MASLLTDSKPGISGLRVPALAGEGRLRGSVLWSPQDDPSPPFQPVKATLALTAFTRPSSAGTGPQGDPLISDLQVLW